jgi:hypothetical protein
VSTSRARRICTSASASPSIGSSDIEAERLEVHRLHEGRYGRPEVLRSADELTSPVLPGFSFDLSAILKPTRTNK